MKKALIVLSALALAACQTPAPDASHMQAGPDLTMPPSYDLRPPKPEVMAEIKAEEEKVDLQKEEGSFWGKLAFWRD